MPTFNGADSAMKAGDSTTRECGVHTCSGALCRLLHLVAAIGIHDGDLLGRGRWVVRRRRECVGGLRGGRGSRAGTGARRLRLLTELLCCAHVVIGGIQRADVEVLHRRACRCAV